MSNINDKTLGEFLLKLETAARKEHQDQYKVNVYRSREFDIFLTYHAIGRLKERFSDYFYDWFSSSFYKINKAIKRLNEYQETKDKKLLIRNSKKKIYAAYSKVQKNDIIVRINKIRFVVSTKENNEGLGYLYDIVDNSLTETQVKYILKTCYIDNKSL